MGWLWGSNKSTKGDPLRDLDPSLRDFLAKESPVKYTTAPPPPPPPETPSTTESEAPAADPTKPVVPPQSLYPDGRFAHLWSTYRPLSEIEAETKSDQEKLQDIFEGYKDRKAAIGRAAVENCVMEQLTLNDCIEKGGWVAKMTMCRAENKVFFRCYETQARFLKALGYGSAYARPEAVDEAIQMHADTLYHRMLAQEAAVADAKAAGLPEPQFPPMLPSVSVSTSSSTTTAAPVPANEVTAAISALSSPPESAPVSSSKDGDDGLPQLMPETQKLLKPSAQAALRERMKDMTPTERELEEKGMLMSVKMNRETGKLMMDINEERKKRREEGKATLGDNISAWFGW